MRRGFALSGRETIGAYKRLRFGEQVNAVRQDLVERIWMREARVITNSFGRYLFIHAQLGLAPFSGRVLLLSQIICFTEQTATVMRLYQPRADVLTW